MVNCTDFRVGCAVNTATPASWQEAGKPESSFLGIPGQPEQKQEGGLSQSQLQLIPERKRSICKRGQPEVIQGETAEVPLNNL